MLEDDHDGVYIMHPKGLAVQLGGAPGTGRLESLPHGEIAHLASAHTVL